MSWPSPNDYNDVVQSPRTAFEDGALRSSLPECNALGLPKPRSGNFAVAYKLQSAGGNWAVKCFTRQPPQDSQQRYAAIAEYLDLHRSRYMVEFTYLERGIRVRSEWYPIVKMQWAEGDPLHIFVQKNLSNPAKLAQLAIQWVQMIQALRQASIAHGDLQHGNVVVTSSGLKLVDYDGMFVPTLAGKRSTELGQPNYQHPRRTDLDFGPYLDNFSGWVIYVSLVALSTYPNLWQTFRGGDDCLLFRRADFEDPDHSRVIKALEHCQNQQLRDLIEFFKIALYSAPSSVPNFDSAAAIPAAIATVTETPSIPSWVHDHVAIRPPAVMQEQPTTSSIDQSWVLDFIAPAASPPAFCGDIALLRIFVWCSAVAVIAAFAASSVLVGLISVFAVVVTVFVCFWRYKAESAVQMRTECAARLRNAEGEWRGARKALEDVDSKKRALLIIETEQVGKLNREIQAVFTDEKKHRDAVDRVLRQATASAMEGKHRIDQQEASELQQLQNTVGNTISNLTQQIARSQQAEMNELSTLLKDKQREFIHRQLEAVRLTPGAIPGIGTYVINNLIYAGVRTAADCISLQYKKIPSVGQRRVAAILSWRQQLEAEAQRRMPTALPHQEENAIKAKYAGPRAQLQSQMSALQQAMASQEAAIHQRHAAARAPFDSQIAAENTKHAREQQRIQAESKKRQDALQEAITRAHQKAQDAITKVERPAQEQRQALQSAQWSLAKTRVESGRFRKVTFHHYIRHVAIGR